MERKMNEIIEIVMLQYVVKKGNVMGYIKFFKQFDRVGCLIMNNVFLYILQIFKFFILYFRGVMFNNVYVNKK